MKLILAELLLCETFYQVAAWFSVNYGMIIPAEQEFTQILEKEEIQTIGIWLDSYGTIAVMKNSKGHYLTSLFRKGIEFPFNSVLACQIVRDLERFKKQVPPKITIWTTADIARDFNLDIKLSSFLEQHGFHRDFLNNWDYLGNENRRF